MSFFLFEFQGIFTKELPHDEVPLLAHIFMGEGTVTQRTDGNPVQVHNEDFAGLQVVVQNDGEFTKIADEGVHHTSFNPVIHPMANKVFANRSNGPFLLSGNHDNVVAHGLESTSSIDFLKSIIQNINRDIPTTDIFHVGHNIVAD